MGSKREFECRSSSQRGTSEVMLERNGLRKPVPEATTINTRAAIFSFRLSMQTIDLLYVRFRDIYHCMIRPE